MTIALVIPEFAVPNTEHAKAGEKCKSRKSLRDDSFHIAPLNLAFYSVTLAFVQLLYYLDLFIPAYSANVKFHPYLKGPLLIAYVGMFLNCLFSNFKQRRILQLIITLLPLISIQVVAILLNPTEAISIVWLAVLCATGVIAVVIWAIWCSIALRMMQKGKKSVPRKVPEICVVGDGQMASANISVTRKLAKPSSWTCGRYTVYPLRSPEDDHCNQHPELGKNDALSTNRDIHIVNCCHETNEERDKEDKGKPKGAEKVELDNGYGSL